MFQSAERSASNISNSRPSNDFTPPERASALVAVRADVSRVPTCGAPHAFARRTPEERPRPCVRDSECARDAGGGSTIRLRAQGRRRGAAGNDGPWVTRSRCATLQSTPAFGTTRLVVGLRRAMTDWVSSDSEVSLHAGIEHTGPISALTAFDAPPLRRPAHTITSVGGRQHQRFAGLAVSIRAPVLTVAAAMGLGRAQWTVSRLAEASAQMRAPRWEIGGAARIPATRDHGGVLRARHQPIPAFNTPHSPS